MAVGTLEETELGNTWVLDEPLARTSHALVSDGRVWLVDPTDEPEALERAAALGTPVAVLQLLDRHNRDCAAVAGRLAVPHLRVPQELPAAPFAVVPVMSWRFWREVALWWPARRALVVAEVFGTAPTYAPGPRGVGVQVTLRLMPPRRLASYRPDHLLVGHGPAMHGAGTPAALDEAVARSRSDALSAAAAVLKAGSHMAKR
jgi:hypothetical protein